MRKLCLILSIPFILLSIHTIVLVYDGIDDEYSSDQFLLFGVFISIAALFVLAYIRIKEPAS